MAPSRSIHHHFSFFLQIPLIVFVIYWYVYCSRRVLIKHVDWCAVWRSFIELHIPDVQREQTAIVSRKPFSRSHPLPLEASFTPSTSVIIGKAKIISCPTYVSLTPSYVLAAHVAYLPNTRSNIFITLTLSTSCPSHALKPNLFTTHPPFAAVQLFIPVPRTLTWNEMKRKESLADGVWTSLTAFTEIKVPFK